MPGIIVRLGPVEIQCADPAEAAEAAACLASRLREGQPTTSTQTQAVSKESTAPKNRKIAMLKRLQQARRVGEEGVSTSDMADHLSIGVKGVGGLVYRLAESIQRLGMRPEEVFDRRPNSAGDTIWLAGRLIDEAIERMRNME